MTTNFSRVSHQRRKNGIVIISIAVIAVILFGTLIAVSQRFLAIEFYYQTKESVVSGQIITTDMITEVAAKEGTAPQTAISLADIQSGVVKSKYDMSAHEVLTYNNMEISGNVNSAISTNNMSNSFLCREDKETSISC